MRDLEDKYLPPPGMPPPEIPYDELFAEAFFDIERAGFTPTPTRINRWMKARGLKRERRMNVLNGRETSMRERLLRAAGYDRVEVTRGVYRWKKVAAFQLATAMTADDLKVHLLQVGCRQFECGRAVPVFVSYVNLRPEPERRLTCDGCVEAAGAAG